MTVPADGKTRPSLGGSDLTLVVRRVIRATPDKLFRAWTTPQQLVDWWGPDGVICPGAEVDLRVGGRYRIANRMPDGSVLWIVGVFEHVDPPNELAYTWSTDDTGAANEHVTVRFVSVDSGTEVVIVHRRIAGRSRRDQHEKGWLGCLVGLATYAGS